MNVNQLIRVGVLTVTAVFIHTAQALQATTTINLGSASTNIVDVNPSDSISPVFTLSSYQSGVGISQWGSPYWFNQASSDWTTPLSLTYASSPPGASAFASYSGPTGIASASITGFVDGDTVYAGTNNRAAFLLGVGTQATFAFDGGRVMTGADPYDSSHEAYAHIWAYFQDASDYSLLASDFWQWDAWSGDTNASRSFSLTIVNNGTSDITGWLDITGMTETISRVQPTPISEPTTFGLCLAGLGLLGLARRRTWT